MLLKSIEGGKKDICQQDDKLFMIVDIFRKLYCMYNILGIRKTRDGEMNLKLEELENCKGFWCKKKKCF